MKYAIKRGSGHGVRRDDEVEATCSAGRIGRLAPVGRISRSEPNGPLALSLHTYDFKVRLGVMHYAPSKPLHTVASAKRLLSSVPSASILLFVLSS